MIVQIENLRKRFGRFDALQGLNLDVPRGSVFSLIGANGAGKTTTLKILMNFTQPTAGRVIVLGVDSRSLSPTVLTRIGYVSENQRMPGRMRVSEYLEFLRPCYPDWDGAFEAELLQRLRLPLERRIKDLSHGMRIKMALACALPYRPSLLVMDEPFSGLDPLSRDDLIRGLKLRDEATTVLMSSHELTEVEDVTTHVAFLDRGKLVFQESKRDLLARVRRVRVTLKTAMNTPERLPDHWFDVSVASNVLTFVDTQFMESRLAAEIRGAVGEVTLIDTQPVELRSIYTTLARAAGDREVHG